MKDESAVMSPKDAASYLGISLTSLWRLDRSDPAFPRKIKFSARCVRYTKADIDAYLEHKKGGQIK